MYYTFLMIFDWYNHVNFILFVNVIFLCCIPLFIFQFFIAWSTLFSSCSYTELFIMVIVCNPYYLSFQYRQTSKTVALLCTNMMQDVVCVYLWPQVYVVCPNHEVVVFQPWIGTTPYLGSVDNYAFYSKPPAPLVSTVFFGSFHFPPLS